MPHFVRVMLHGNPQFSIDWRWVKNNPLRQVLGKETDAVEITEAEAREGIDKLRDRYFPEDVPAPDEVYHGA